MPRIRVVTFVLVIIFGVAFGAQNDDKNSQTVRRLAVTANQDCRLFPWTSDYLPFVFDLLGCIVNIVQQIARTLYFVLDTIVITFCQVITNIFSGARQLADFFELLGYCLRALLNMNYNLVSSILTWFQKLIQAIRDVLQYMWESFLWLISSLFKTIFRLLDSVVLSFSSLFQFAGQGVTTTYDTTGVALHKSYNSITYLVTLPGSALMTFITTVRAIVELLVMTVINTIILLFEFVVKLLLLLKRSIYWTFTTLWTFITNVCDSIIGFGKKLTNGMKFVVMSVYNDIAFFCESVIHSLLLVVGAIFKGLFSVFYYIGWSFAMVLLTFVDAIMKGVHHLLNTGRKAFTGIQSVFVVTSSYTPGGLWTVISLSSSLLIIFSVWFVFGINVLAFSFETMERTIQSSVSLLTQTAIADQSDADNSDEEENQFRAERPGPSARLPDTEEFKPCSANELKRKLAEEKEKSLCVVCQDQSKSVLIMPCKHLCICRRCADILMQHNSWRRRLCPLCRRRIISTMDVYA